MHLEPGDLDALDGRLGDAGALAMRVLVRMARLTGAERLIDITAAHIDSCLFHGRAGLDFAERLVQGGGRVAVPATLNVSSLDLLHPGLYRGDPETARLARRLMDAYTALGCRPTWTCAPYQLPERPVFGQHIAWAESNAIVFANSVIGARTDRYGDFLDICAALTGRAPEAGLHLDANRRGEVRFRLRGVSSRLLESDVLYPVLGHLVGKATGIRIPVIDGLPPGVPEDRLKALGAGAASSGAVAMFHAVGLTPEAPTLEAAFGGRTPERTLDVTPDLLRTARDELTTSESGTLAAVSLGTPHLSLAEFERLVPLVAGRRFAAGVDVYVNTARHILEQVRERGWLDTLEDAGVQLVVDTCTYVTPILRRTSGLVMTDSAKWAWYAPGNLGVDVAFGSMEECLESASIGRVWRDATLWE
ncbi:MAG: aconitase X catalytic domain-containing protein [Gemmatimonadota bacterium]